METLDQILKPGKEVIFEFIGENGCKVKYSTKIMRSIQKEYLTLIMDSRESDLLQLQVGDQVNLTCRDELQHVYNFITEFVEVRYSELPIIIVARPSKIENATRRNFFRCHVRLQFSYFHRNKEYKGEVINLSSGGMFSVVEIDSSIIVGARLVCKLFLPKTKEPLLFVGRVVGIRKIDEAPGLAMSFQNLTKDQQSQIVKYLFDKQRVLLVQKRVNSEQKMSVL